MTRNARLRPMRAVKLKGPSPVHLLAACTPSCNTPLPSQLRCCNFVPFDSHHGRVDCTPCRVHAANGETSLAKEHRTPHALHQRRQHHLSSPTHVHTIRGMAADGGHCPARTARHLCCSPVQLRYDECFIVRTAHSCCPLLPFLLRPPTVPKQ